MQVGIVRGSVVSTNKAEKLQGLKLLIVKPINIESFEEKGDYFVAIDAVGAGEGEVVICVGGSSSRQTSVTENKPVDQSIVAILDSIDIGGKRVFEKFKNEPGKSGKSGKK
jgi:ethanolamine utilization protein EutN/carbon dioxide concentrating mechanism protein CcmL